MIWKRNSYRACDRRPISYTLKSRGCQTFLPHRPFDRFFGLGQTPTYLILSFCKFINLNVFWTAALKESVLLKKRSNRSNFTNGAPGGKEIFEISAAIEFIFVAMPRVNSRLVKLVKTGHLLLGVENSRLVKRTLVRTEEFKTTSAILFAQTLLPTAS
ncbi:hypothetical protein TNCV_1605691 [Trichonephila clavipes]|nr:hypothetical protein TNCV_1605691 [Trichonephila clavipes]